MSSNMSPLYENELRWAQFRLADTFPIDNAVYSS